jgi:hypothetical protein
VETRGRRAGQGAQAVPPVAAGPHPAVSRRAAAQEPARIGVQAPARIGAGALHRTAEPAPPRTGELALLRTVGQQLLKTVTLALLKTVTLALVKIVALVTARTGVRVLPRTGVPVPLTGVPAVRAPVRPPTAGERQHPAGVVLLRRARVHSAGPPGVPPTADPGRMAGRLENAAARPRAQVTSRDGQADPDQEVPAEAFDLPAVPARTASPAGRPGPRPATGLGGPPRAETRVATPGPGAVRAGPPTVMVNIAGDLPLLVTAKLGLAAEPAVLARLGRRVPPMVATGAQVLRGHARMARAGTTPTVAGRGRVVSDPVPPARRIGRSAIEVTPPGGRHVTARQDPRATQAATGPHGRPAAATAIVAATAPGVATAVGAASAAGAPAVSAQAADTPGAVTAPVAASAPGLGGTRLRPGRPARAGRSFRTRSLPTNSIPRHGPS